MPLLQPDVTRRQADGRHASKGERQRLAQHRLADHQSAVPGGRIILATQRRDNGRRGQHQRIHTRQHGIQLGHVGAARLQCRNIVLRRQRGPRLQRRQHSR